MLLPSMPLYVKQLGADKDLVGLVMGIFTLTSVVFRPLAGKIADTKGRKIIFYTGLAIIILSIFSYNFISSIIMLLALRLLHGAGWGTATTASSTMATDIIPKSRLGEGMSIFGLTIVLSLAIGPAIGLYIVDKWGFDILFFTSVLLASLGGFWAVFIRQHPIQYLDRNLNKPQNTSLLEKNAFMPAIVIFFITLTYGSVVTFIALYASERGVNNIGTFFTVYAITLLILRPPLGRLIDKKGFNTLIIPGIISVGLTMITLSFAKDTSSFLLAAILFGIGIGAVQPSLQAISVYNVPPERRGAANATYMSGFDLGIGIGSILCGIIAKFFGYSMMYLLGVIPVLISIFFYLLLSKKNIKLE